MSSSGASKAAQAGEFTIDELANRVNMTVRNVRAYAGRGIIPPPRLEGRTGYYGPVHEQRLRLVRAMLDRGYTLAAVERALEGQSDTAMHHALDLLGVLSGSGDEEEPETMSVEDLAALTMSDRADLLLSTLTEAGLATDNGDGTVLVHEPSLVRAGGAAVRYGLSLETVVEILPTLRTHLSAIAETFVEVVRAEIWAPFAEAKMPEEGWPDVVAAIETLLPIAGQTVLSIFRRELTEAIEVALEEETAKVAQGREEG